MHLGEGCYEYAAPLGYLAASISHSCANVYFRGDPITILILNFFHVCRSALEVNNEFRTHVVISQVLVGAIKKPSCDGGTARYKGSCQRIFHHTNITSLLL